MDKEEKAIVTEWFDLAVNALSEAEDLTVEEMEDKRQEWIDKYKQMMQQKPLEASTSHLDN